MRIFLHELIRLRGQKQKEVAHDTGIIEQRLCQITTGAVNPTPKEIKTLCRYFKEDEATLFFPINHPKISRSKKDVTN